MIEKFMALKNDESGYSFFNNTAPKCPHCAVNLDIVESEAFELYEEGENEVRCRSCKNKFMVVTEISYSFHTDDQSSVDD